MVAWRPRIGGFMIMTATWLLCAPPKSHQSPLELIRHSRHSIRPLEQLSRRAAEPTTPFAADADFLAPCPVPVFVNGLLQPPPTYNTSSPCSCPAPLISNPNPTTLPTCVGTCCLPCPTIYTFYPPSLSRIFAAVTFARIASFACIAISALSSLILPGKRTHPAITALWLIMAIALYEGIAFFWTVKPTLGTCASTVEDATMQNNPLCAVQGTRRFFKKRYCVPCPGVCALCTLAVFASHCVLYWGLVLILSLFLQAVHHSNFLESHYIKVFLLGWVIPLGFTLIPLVAGEIQFAWSNYCFVNPEVASKYIFYPAAALVVPSIILGAWTFGHIFWVETTIKATLRRSGDFTALNRPDRKRDSASSTNTSASASTTRSNPAVTIRNAIQYRLIAGFLIQWRAIALAIALVLGNFVNWAFYLSEAPKFLSLRDPTSRPFQDFLLCLYTHEDQAVCVSLVASDVPRLWLGALAESCVPLMGIIGFIVFTIKLETPTEWRHTWIKWRKRRKSTALCRLESATGQEVSVAGSPDGMEIMGSDLVSVSKGADWL
ncbi:hypothetical protein BC937DRAFT_95639 [Endogone sp. FLAS-F59071]|nr:hypothetical protein BC937DRAFT_95639 [Endogone sp. FLAS-F59071]|eukprot:RUS13231.1 hypothetical protein BC937DRAFT_95639 [Endogone sp. FLAS-F59071]